MEFIRREIDYFIKVSVAKSFTKASDLTGVQQAGLSKAVKKLELELGHQLFIRKHRELELTDFGRSFEAQVLALFEMWNAGMEESLKQFEKVSGRISIGAHSTVAINTLSPVIGKLGELYPSLDLDVELLPSQEGLERVLSCHLDCGLVINPLLRPELVLKKIGNEQVNLYSSSLKQAEKVLYYNPDMINIVKTTKKFERYKKVQIKDYEVLASILKESRSVGILPSPVARRYPQLKKLGKTLSRADLYLAYRWDRPRSASFQAVLNLLVNPFNYS